jgi:serine/threonine protein kinase
MIPRLPKGFSHPVCIGRGGFSSVYRVRQVALDRWVALKIVSEKDPRKRRDLLRESQIQARITVAHIPRIYDTFERFGRIYICMEWIRGVSLRALLDGADLGEVSFDNEQRLYVAEAFLYALAQLHAVGFAHRDLKPENIIIAPDHGVYLVDFGLSKRIAADGFTTEIGVAKGTPAYMAPELWQSGATVDHQCADVFAAGKILLKILPASWHQAVVVPLIHDDPTRRTATATAAYATWQLLTKDLIVSPNWHGLIAALSREHLGRCLLSAAKDLVYAGRTDEAYWLLVESLDEHPDQPDAIGLMERFPVLLRQRRLRRRTDTLLISAAFLAVLIPLAFLTGRHYGSGMERGAARAVERTGFERLSAPAKTGGVRLEQLPLRQSGCEGLNGIVQLVNMPDQGTLFVDGVAFTDTCRARRGIALAWGTHILVWARPDGSRRWKEHVRLLPFQTRRIFIE